MLQFHATLAMRGAHIPQDTLFNTVIPEEQVPSDHPLRPIRTMVNTALETMDEDLVSISAIFNSLSGRELTRRRSHCRSDRLTGPVFSRYSHLVLTRLILKLSVSNVKGDLMAIGVKETFCTIALTLLVTSCATTGNQEWRVVEDYDQTNISVLMIDNPLIRTSAEARDFTSGWVERSDWTGSEEGSALQVRILVYALSNTVFSNKSKTNIEKTIRTVSGDGYLELAEKDKIPTRTGVVDYQFYTVSGLACFFVENYWFDRRTLMYDGVTNGDLDEYVIGNALLQAYYCDENKKSLGLADLEVFLEGIYVKNVYWPAQRFERFDNWDLY